MQLNPLYHRHGFSPASINKHSVTDFHPNLQKESSPKSFSEFTPAFYLDILDADRSPNAADSPRSYQVVCSPG